MKTAITILACLLCGSLCLPSAVVHAADEDTEASVYLVFDPETGEFVTVDSTDPGAQHQAVRDDESGASQPGRATDTANLKLTWIVAAAVVALLGAAAFAWSRRGQSSRA